MIEENNQWDSSISLGKPMEVASMLYILICDDDTAMLTKIGQHVRDFLAVRNIKGKIFSYSDASKISDQILTSCDIVFLDVDFETEEYNGLDIAKRLRKLRNDSIIIFVTNFIEYAPEGYEVHAFRYILKCNLDNDIYPYLSQAIEQISKRKESIKIQVNGEIIDLPIDNILYFEIQQHIITAYVLKYLQKKDVKTYSFYGSLSDLENRLEPQGFLRIHKSFLVNMSHLKKFQCREALLDTGAILRVGEKGYAENKKKYLMWKGWQ